MALIYNFLFTACVITALRSSTACPVSCNCTTSDTSVTVGCQGEGLTAIPRKLPENTSSVDLRDNPVKCDCEFWKYWKILKEKGIQVRGGCHDSSPGLTGTSFQDLKDESFACDGSQVLALASSQPVPTVASSRTIPEAPSYQSVPAVTSSQAVPVVTSSEAVLEAQPVQASPVVTSSQAVPMVTSSQAVLAVTSSQAVPVVTSSEAVLEAQPVQASPVVTSSQAVPIVTSSQPLPMMTSSQAVLAVTSSQAVPVVTSSEAVVEAQPVQASFVVTSSQAVPMVTSSQATPKATSSQVTAIATSSEAVSKAPPLQAVAAVTTSQAVRMVTSSQAVLLRTSSEVPVVRSHQVPPLGVLSRAASLVISSQADVDATLSVPAITSSPAIPTVPSSPAEHVPGLGATTSVLELTMTSRTQTDSEVKVTSSHDVSPTVSGILQGSTTITTTTPPITTDAKAEPVDGMTFSALKFDSIIRRGSRGGEMESPVITTFDAPEKVGLHTTVQVKCVAVGNPPPKVLLTFNDKPAENVADVTVTSRSSETEIEFKAVRSSEIYCEAVNEHGRDKRKMRIVVDQTDAKYMLLRVRLIEETFSGNMENKDSKEFRDIAEKITSQVRSLLSSVTSFLGVSLVKLRPGSVIADILLKTFQDNDDSVKKTLEADINKAKLGNIPVDRYKYSFEQTQACSSEFENVTWNDAAYGETDIVKCPRGARGFAKRNCSVGEWYFADYTDCKSEDFVTLKNQMEEATSRENAEKEISTGLKKLFNLTMPNEDFAIMAGDLTISTEILELVTDFIARKNESKAKGEAHSWEEVELVVNTSSNVLHLHNEQEFIVAQKLLQTASKFILALEKYGLQAAPVMQVPSDKNLGILITENVVMGACSTDPKTISEDVIFPNYRWTELEGLKEKWNVSTFVVLPKDMIKTVKTGNDRIRIAGFLYRTLTRILSFESAYSDKGLAFEINSAVISASMDPKPPSKLNTPVIIASANIHEVDLEGDEPICAFWDFKMNYPHGGWSEEGCNTSSYNTMQTTCQCDHMTNFAVLRSKALPPSAELATKLIKDFLHCIYIACWIIIAFAVVTFLILLILCPWLEPDRTWAMHMCVCASIAVTFVLILLGLATYNDLVLCNIFSFLAHYFFLCAFSWILAEGVYMRSWVTQKGPQKIYWIGYFLLGWGLPGIAMFITWLINKLINFESYMSCWMSIFNPLIWVFFAPAIIFFVVSCFFFVIIWRAITGLPRQALKSQYRNTRFRVHIRYCLILMLMFIVTWIVGVLLITFYTKALLCVLFIICCIITGFMLLLFYVVMDRQVRDAFKHCCCCWRRSRRGSYWVKGQPDDVFKQSPEEELEYRQQERLQERQRLVSEGTEQQEQDQDIELNGVEKSHQCEEPLISVATAPGRQEALPFESSTESFDPLYERVRHSATVNVEPDRPTEDEEEGPKPEPVYSQVIKPKRLRHPESDSDDEDDELLTPEEREARWMRGLTREQVIRMAKKSDASKRVLKQYDSPTGSKEKLGGPVHLLNQQELDEELKKFRKFFSHDKTPAASAPSTSTPKSDEGPSTPSGSFKRETDSEVTRPISPSTTVQKDKKKVGTPKLPGETSIDSSLRELQRKHDDDDSPNRPTSVSDDSTGLRESLLQHFASTQQQGGAEDDWRELLKALKE